MYLANNFMEEVYSSPFSFFINLTLCHVLEVITISNGCCYRFRDCSVLGRCLILHDPIFNECGYKRNLEQGLNFYREELGKEGVKSRMEYLTQKYNALYINMDNRLFCILGRSDSSLSFNLSSDQRENLTSFFDRYEIPYKTEPSEEECIMEPATPDIPANSRLVMSLDGIKYHILNYNACLLREATVLAIKELILAHVGENAASHNLNIDFELIGTYARVNKKPAQDNMPKQSKLQEHAAGSDTTDNGSTESPDVKSNSLMDGQLSFF